MKSFHLLFTLFLTIFYSSCHSQTSQLKIENIRILDVPSASGMNKMKETILAVGDNSPYLYYLNKNFEVVKFKAISSTEGIQNGKVPKKIKPDFEAIEFINENEFIIFGSGSKSPIRDILVMASLSDTTIQTYSLTSFYRHLATLDPIKSGEINIEGAAFYTDTLYLLNRLNSVIISVNYQEFLSFVIDQTPLKTLQTYTITLPSIGDIPSGFSGATIGMDPPHLIFTSSVENTGDAYADGEILGSFVGMVDLRHLNDRDKYRFARFENEGAPLKVESVTIDKINPDNSIRLLFCTDSDGGESVLIEGVFIR